MRKGVRSVFGRWFGSSPLTKQKTRAATLIEVMIASVLFLVVSAALFFTLRSSKNHLAPSDEQSQNLRACLLSVDALGQELASAWVTEPTTLTPASVLRYRVPVRDASGQALTGPTGDLLWSAPRTVDLQAGKLMRTEGAEQKIVSNLGPNGSVQFRRLSPTLLEATVKSGFGKGYELTRSYRLKNQF